MTTKDTTRETTSVAGTRSVTAGAWGDRDLRPADYHINRFHIDLDTSSVRGASQSCEDLEDVLGGIARGFKQLAQCRIDDAYSPGAHVVLNFGCLTGSGVMTGLRPFFHAYSPLKRSGSGRPSAMWSAGSGRFGGLMADLEIDELHLRGRAPSPCMLRIRPGAPGGAPEFHFEDAGTLVGLRTHAKIQALQARFPNAHFAVIGPGGADRRNKRASRSEKPQF